MKKRHSVVKHVLKNLQSFRTRQRKAIADTNEGFRNTQYRELQEILSPFWAWRSKSL
jgi:hypothetical protein